MDRKESLLDLKIPESLNSLIVSSQDQLDSFTDGLTIEDKACEKFLKETFHVEPNQTTLEMARLRLQLLQSLAEQESLIRHIEKGMDNGIGQQTSNSHLSSLNSNSLLAYGSTHASPNSLCGSNVLRAWEFLLSYRRAFETFPKHIREFYLNMYDHKEEPFSFTSITSGIHSNSKSTFRHIRDRLPVPGESSLAQLSPMPKYFTKTVKEETNVSEAILEPLDETSVNYTMQSEQSSRPVMPDAVEEIPVLSSIVEPPVDDTQAPPNAVESSKLLSRRRRSSQQRHASAGLPDKKDSKLAIMTKKSKKKNEDRPMEDKLELNAAQKLSKRRSNPARQRSRSRVDESIS